MDIIVAIFLEILAYCCFVLDKAITTHSHETIVKDMFSKLPDHVPPADLKPGQVVPHFEQIPPAENRWVMLPPSVVGLWGSGKHHCIYDRIYEPPTFDPKSLLLPPLPVNLLQNVDAAPFDLRGAQDKTKNTWMFVGAPQIFRLNVDDVYIYNNIMDQNLQVDNGEITQLKRIDRIWVNRKTSHCLAVDRVLEFNLFSYQDNGELYVISGSRRFSSDGSKLEDEVFDTTASLIDSDPNWKSIGANNCPQTPIELFRDFQTAKLPRLQSLRRAQR